MTRNQVGGNVSWVRIPPTPHNGKALKIAVFGAFFFLQLYEILRDFVRFLLSNRVDGEWLKTLIFKLSDN